MEIEQVLTSDNGDCFFYTVTSILSSINTLQLIIVVQNSSNIKNIRHLINKLILTKNNLFSNKNDL